MPCGEARYLEHEPRIASRSASPDLRQPLARAAARRRWARDHLRASGDHLGPRAGGHAVSRRCARLARASAWACRCHSSGLEPVAGRPGRCRDSERACSGRGVAHPHPAGSESVRVDCIISSGMSAGCGSDLPVRRSAHSKTDPSVTVNPPDRPIHRARSGTPMVRAWSAGAVLPIVVLLAQPAHRTESLIGAAVSGEQRCE